MLAYLLPFGLVLGVAQVIVALIFATTSPNNEIRRHMWYYLMAVMAYFRYMYIDMIRPWYHGNFNESTFTYVTVAIALSIYQFAVLFGRKA